MAPERPTPTGPAAPDRPSSSAGSTGGNIWSYDPAIHPSSTWACWRAT